MSLRNRHLAAVTDNTQSRENLTAMVAQLGTGTARVADAGTGVSLTRAARLDLERAEGFLFDLAAEFDREPTVARLSWLLGTAEAHLANCVEIARSVTR